MKKYPQLLPAFAVLLLLWGCASLHEESPRAEHRLPDVRLKHTLERIIRSDALPENFELRYSRSKGGGMFVLDRSGWRKIIQTNRTGSARTAAEATLAEHEIIAFIRLIHKEQIWEFDDSGLSGGWPSYIRFTLTIGDSQWLWEGTHPNNKDHRLALAIMSLVPNYFGIR